MKLANHQLMFKVKSFCIMQKNALCSQTHQKLGEKTLLKVCQSIPCSLLNVS